MKISLRNLTDRQLRRLEAVLFFGCWFGVQVSVLDRIGDDDYWWWVGLALVLAVMVPTYGYINWQWGFRDMSRIHDNFVEDLKKLSEKR